MCAMDSNFAPDSKLVVVRTSIIALMVMSGNNMSIEYLKKHVPKL